MTTQSTYKNTNFWLDILSKHGKTPMQILYNRFNTMYGERWKRNFKTEEELIEWSVDWAAAFSEMHINPEMIKRGLKNCLLLYDNPPTLPQFIKACLTKSRDEQIYQDTALMYEMKPLDKKHAVQRIEKLKQQFRPKEKDNNSTILAEHQWIFAVLEKHKKDPKKTSSSALKCAYKAAANLGYRL